jgi:hypothetical protein
MSPPAGYACNGCESKILLNENYAAAMASISIMKSGP